LDSLFDLFHAHSSISIFVFVYGINNIIVGG